MYPSSQDLRDYLDLYKLSRVDERNSTTGYVIWGLEKGLSYVTGQAPTVDKIDKIIQQVEEELGSTNDQFEDWWEVIFFLEEKAKEIQTGKRDQNRESLLCEVLYALRSEIIKVLLSKDDDQKKQFNEHVIELLKEKKRIKHTLYEAFMERRGKDVQKAIVDLKKVTVKLALVGDKKNILRSLQFGELNYLKMPSEIKKSVCTRYANEAIPYVLQDNFEQTIFEDQLQKIINISFEEFSQNPIARKRLISTLKNAKGEKSSIPVIEQKKQEQVESGLEKGKSITPPEPSKTSADPKEDPPSPKIEDFKSDDESENPSSQKESKDKVEKIVKLPEKASPEKEKEKIDETKLTKKPSTDILYAYLDLYEIARADDRKSTSTYIQYGLEKSLSLVSISVPVIDELSTILEVVRRELKKLDSDYFQDWVNLIFLLGEQAKKAQGLKYIKAEDSWLCNTLHGMRNAIIQELLDENCKYHLQYKGYIETLLKERKVLKDNIDNRFLERNGKGVKEKNEELKELDVKLAYLGDKKSLLRALLANEFKYLHILDPKEQDRSACASYANEAVPYPFQDRFNEVIYKDLYQKILSISFERFQNNAAARTAAIERLKEEKKLIFNENKDLDLKEDKTPAENVSHTEDSKKEEQSTQGETKSTQGEKHPPFPLPPRKSSKDFPGNESGEVQVNRSPSLSKEENETGKVSGGSLFSVDKNVTGASEKEKNANLKRTL